MDDPHSRRARRGLHRPQIRRHQPTLGAVSGGVCPDGWSAELTEQGGHVGADPFFGDEPVSDAVKLVADVFDGAAGRGDAQELAGVGAADPQPDRDLSWAAKMSSMCA
jgi:hypothetical protein